MTEKQEEMFKHAMQLIYNKLEAIEKRISDNEDELSDIKRNVNILRQETSGIFMVVNGGLENNN